MLKISEIIILVILTIIFVIKESIQTNEPVVHGNLVKEKELSFLVALTYPNHQVGCSGSLVALRNVLTAAHCKKTKEENKLMYVVAGDIDLNANKDKPNKQMRKIIKFIQHPQYNNNGNASYPHDIGIVKVDSEFKITEYVSMIPIAPSSMVLQDGSLVNSGGFGAFGYTMAFLYNGSLANENSLDGKARYGTFRILDNNLKHAGTFVPMYQSTFDNDQQTKYLGDSGGPVFMASYDLDTLFAVSSYIQGPDLIMNVMITHPINREWLMEHLRQKRISNEMPKLEMSTNRKLRRSGQSSILDEMGRKSGYFAFKTYLIIFFNVLWGLNFL